MNAASTEWLRERLSEYATRYGIPGASAAIIHGGECGTAATGLLNLETRVATSTDALFQIGSITKTFTATLALQLLEQNRIALEDPVRRHLPYFRVASDEISETVTIRQLLTHTSGIDGDYFPDTGSDTACVEKYVRACTELGQIHDPDEGISYCNAGPIAIAAMLQELTGKSWDVLLQEKIVKPLGLKQTITDYARFPHYRVAVGHLSDPVSKKLKVASRIHLPRGMGPTGATLHMSAPDLAQFGRLFLEGGKVCDGPTIIEKETIELSLQQRAAWQIAPWTGMGMGLGWLLYRWDGHDVFGHDGGTIGQHSFLRIMPEANLVVALLTNGGPAKDLYTALFRDAFGTFADTRLPTAPAAIPLSDFETGRVLGRYANKSTVATVAMTDGQLRLRTEPRQLTDVFQEEDRELLPISPQACRIAAPDRETPEIAVFHQFDAADGHARYLTLNYRDLLLDQK